MASKSFAEKMNEVKLMLAGIKQYPERLARRGLDAEFISRFEKSFQEVQTLDNEQEKLKAELKSKSAALTEKSTGLDALYIEAKKMVKVEIESTAWKEFGIQDKR